MINLFHDKSFFGKTQFFALLRLAITSDEVLVEVVVKRLEQYDLVKIKPT